VSESKANAIFQAVKNGDRVTVRTVCEATGIPRSTTNRYLLQLYKAGRVRRSLIEDESFFGTFLYQAVTPEEIQEYLGRVSEC
jgi:DNA-binding IclR family transcriptional regulator